MNWNLETTTKEQAVLLLPSPDHIQMPSCDLLCLNTIIGLDTGTGKRNLVCCIWDISRGNGTKQWSWATQLQPRWLQVSGVRCNLGRKLWQPSSSQVWWWAWLRNGAQRRDTRANPQPCWEKVGSCLWLPGSQCHTYIASGVKAVLLGCAALIYLVIGFFRRVFKFPLYLKKKWVKLSLNLYCLWHVNRDWKTNSCSYKWKSSDYFSYSVDRLNYTHNCISI